MTTQAEAVINEAKLAEAIDKGSPFCLYRPKVFIDGDQWCVLYGENLQDGVAGFGETPELAKADFENNWFHQKATKEGN